MLLAFFLESMHPPTIAFLMHFLVNCSHARMHLKRSVWSLWDAIYMFLKSSIGKLNEHMNISGDRLPAPGRKYDFLYAGVDFTVQPQNRTDRLGPKLI